MFFALMHLNIPSIDGREKRPTYMLKETYIYAKRDLHRR